MMKIVREKNGLVHSLILSDNNNTERYATMKYTTGGALYIKTNNTDHGEGLTKEEVREIIGFLRIAVEDVAKGEY